MAHANRRWLALAVAAFSLAFGSCGPGAARASAAPLGESAPAAAPAPAPAALNSSDAFSDSFALDPARSTDPLYGLNVGLEERQTGAVRGLSYTRTSGRGEVSAARPKPSSAQVGNASYRNRLVFAGESSAVMLGAPAVADRNGLYTVSTTIDPVAGDKDGRDGKDGGSWGSVVLNRSHRSTGFAAGGDTDLALTVSPSGRLALFHGGPHPFWTGQALFRTRGVKVGLTVSTRADRLIMLTVDDVPVVVPSAALPADVTRWPSSAFVYLGAHLPAADDRVAFGDGRGDGLTVSSVDTAATSDPKRFVDTFDGAPHDTPDFGLNDGLSARQPSLVSAHYTVVSGRPGLPTTPAAGAAQVNHPRYPNVLSFPSGPAAVRLDKPATADLSGTYSVHAVLTPAVGARSGEDWSSLVVSHNAQGTGWVEGHDVALGLRVRADGGLQLFQGGTALWHDRQAVPAAESYDVSVTVDSGPGRQAVVLVNGTRFTVRTPGPLPRDGYVHLGSHAASGHVATVHDLRVSMVGGFSYYGYFDIMDPRDNVDRSAEVAPWTTMNMFVEQDPAKGFLDYCGPASCVVDAGSVIFDGRLRPDGPELLRAFREHIGSNIDKVAAVYMVDEPYYQGLTPAQTRTATAWIRAAFPGKMIILAMDAQSLDDPAATIPEDIDLVGFDDYCKGRGTTHDHLARLKGKLSSEHQHLFLIPESASSSATDIWGCESTTDAAMAVFNTEYRAIAASDPRVLYLMNFRWLGPRQYTDIPKTVRTQQALGTGVINATPTPPASSVGSYHDAPGTGSAVFTEGTRTGATIGSAALGGAHDVPLTGHWNGPGVDTLGVYRPDTQTFLLSDDNATFAVSRRFGLPGDLPVVGDWTGQGRTTIGVYRPSTQTFLLSNDNETVAFTVAFGRPGDVPLVGNWSGDGTSTVGVYRPGTREFRLSHSNTAPREDRVVVFGAPGDVPVKGDWDGTGTDSIGVYHPGDQTFSGASNTSAAPVFRVAFGNPGDLPVTGNWG